MSVYLDNAASTQLAPEVLQAMLPILESGMGNPSSTHSEGRKLKALIENARKDILKALNCDKEYELTFTSGGTESNNIALRGLVQANELNHIITTEIEHNAVLDTVNDISNVTVHYCKVDEVGRISLDHLKELLLSNPKALVSIMHGHNELGTLHDLEKISELCDQHNALFHSDTVQTVFRTDWSSMKLKPDSFIASAHKFHGPKGIGFLLTKKGLKCAPLSTGGGQEKGLRSGTENTASIVGMAKAFQIALNSIHEVQDLHESLNSLLLDELTKSQVSFDLNSPTANRIPSTVNIKLLYPVELSTLLFSLDLKGICVSGGSACSSGAMKTSRVIKHLHGESKNPSIRISFSRYTQNSDIQKLVNGLKETLLHA